MPFGVTEVEGQPLDRHAIEQHLNEVGDELRAADAGHHTIITVGGSFMALHDLRHSTRDVDTISDILPSLRAAVERVAQRHRLSVTWLNSSAKPYAPQGLAVAECETLVEHPNLTVLGPPAAWVFLMKLNASRPGDDHNDMVALWPFSDFADPEDAIARFHGAYPLEEPDPYLVDYVRRIAGEARRAP
jgi:hypothetical protein